MTDAQARGNFKKYGKSGECAEDGLGGPSVNQVYEITVKKKSMSTFELGMKIVLKNSNQGLASIGPRWEIVW